MIPRLLCGLLIAMIAGPACAQDNKRDFTKTLRHQDRERTYHVHLPKAHTKDKAVPLVIALHGGGGTGKGFDRSTKGTMTKAADKRGWVVVFPEGIAKGWNDGRPQTVDRERKRAGVDDVGFIRKLIGALHASHNIDRTRVYATGISNGGFMSFRLACELSDCIAAIAPVTANMHQKMVWKQPTVPVSVLVINGTADPLVPYKGGHVTVLGQKRGAIRSTDASIKYWVDHNGCKKAPTRKTLPNKNWLDRSRVHVATYSGGKQGSEVILYRVEGGGHTWPGGMQYLPRFTIGPVCRDIDASETILAFFAKHKRKMVERTKGD